MKNMNKKPRLILITGRPGSGKTTLVKEFGLMMNYPVFSRDEIKEGYVNTFGIKQDALPKDTNKIVTDAFFDIVELAVTNNISSIAEAAYPHDVWEWYLERFKNKCDISIVICTIDDSLLAKRRLKRGLKDSGREYYHGDPTATHYKKTGEMLPVGNYNQPELPYPTYIISTKNKYSPSLSLVRKKILKKK